MSSLDIQLPSCFNIRHDGSQQDQTWRNYTFWGVRNFLNVCLDACIKIRVIQKLKKFKNFDLSRCPHSLLSLTNRLDALRKLSKQNSTLLVNQPIDKVLVLFLTLELWYSEKSMKLFFHEKLRFSNSFSLVIACSTSPNKFSIEGTAIEVEHSFGNHLLWSLHQNPYCAQNPEKVSEIE